MPYEVTDEYSLWEYRILRKQWLEILKSEDRNSVYRQYITLLDDNTTWRMVNELRILQSENAPSLHRMLDEWFWERQALGIRRITEEDDSKAKRSVYSLVRVIDEMKAKRALLTRSNFMNSIERAGEDWSDCERTFDRLSSKEPGQERKPDDCVTEEYLTQLRRRVRNNRFDGVITYVNKFLAHSSDPQTRKDYHLSLQSLDEVYKELAGVIRELAIVFSSTHLALTITKGRSVTDGWNKVFAGDEAIVKVREIEKERRKEIETWGL